MTQQPQMPAMPQQPLTPEQQALQARILQGYGTMAQINAAKQRANQLINRSMQAVPGLIGTGSQIGGALTQLLNAWTGHKMLQKANAQENLVRLELGKNDAQWLQNNAQGHSYSQTPQQAQPFAQHQIPQETTEQAPTQINNGTAQYPTVFDQQGS